jgi:hypothetical protein
MRVRIHLNLNNPERAESCIRVAKRSGRSWPCVGYAEFLVLENVRPVVDEAQRRRIAHVPGAKKLPCAYLEGNLVIFSGRLREKSDPRLAAELVKLQTDSEVLRRLLLEYPDAGTALGFNPKTAACFYAQPPKGAAPSRAFLSAPLLLAGHWRYMALEGSFRALSPAELERDAKPASTFEQTAIAKGRTRTQAMLAGEP